MKKFIHLLFLSFLICSTAFGQSKSNKVRILKGPEQVVNKWSSFNGIVGFDESGFYVVKSEYPFFSPGKITLEKYDREMHFIHSAELELKEEGRKKVLEKVLMLDGELYLFTSFFNRKKDKEYLFVQKINKETLEVDKPSRMIGEYDFAGGVFSFGGRIGITLSRDKTKVMVHVDTPNKSYEKDELVFKVFGSEMKEIWGEKVETPYLDKEFGSRGWKLDNDGNVYVIGLVYDGKIITVGGKSNDQYKILSYRKEGGKPKMYDINADGKFISDLQLAIDDNGDLICAGFYSDESTFNVKGSYFFKMSGETQAVQSKSFKEFSIESMLSESTEKEKGKAERNARKGKDLELYKYHLDEIIIREDGGAILIGEQFYKETISSMAMPNGENSSSDDYYYYNDIVVVNLSPEGEIDWVELVPKFQRSVEDGGYYSSYVYAVANDNLYFVFNDHTGNLTRSEGDEVHPAFGLDNVIVLVEVDKNGKETREALFDINDIHIGIRPKLSEQIYANELILFGERKQTHRFIKLKFK